MSAAFDPYHKWLGIRAHEQPPTHYRLLGVSPFESDADVISHAADQRMMHIRSLQSGQHAALSQKLLNEISSARVCLLDPQKKAAYDARLRSVHEAPIAAPVVQVKVEPVARAKHGAPLIAIAVVVGLLLLFVIVGVVVLTNRGGKTEVADNSGGRRTPPVVDTPRSVPKRKLDAQESSPFSLPSAPQEGADAASNSPIRIEPATPTIDENLVYLDDLPDVDSETGWGVLGKHGQTGFPDPDKDEVFIDGAQPAHALSMHAVNKGVAFATYRLDGGFQAFTATASTMKGGGTPLTFRVLGDGELLWTSQPIKTAKDSQNCVVSIAGVQQLRLEVDCPGPNRSMWSVWVEPRLVRAN